MNNTRLHITDLENRLASLPDRRPPEVIERNRQIQEYEREQALIEIERRKRERELKAEQPSLGQALNNNL